MRNKPVWAEGVLLGQQHFQAFDAHQEYVQAQRQLMLSPFAFGFKTIQFDSTALSRGIVSINKLNLIFESGRYVEYNTSENNELTLTLAPETQETLIYVGMAANTSVGEITGYNNNSQLTAYKADYVELADQHDASRTREVMVAIPQLSLFSENDSRNYFEVLPLLKVVRGSDGNFSIDPTFIPPIIDITISPYLKDLLTRTNNLVNAKANVLLDRRQKLGAVTDFGPNEINSFMLLNGLLPSAKMLEHLKNIGTLHPERLYCEFTNLLSRISLFEHSELINQLPAYNHQQLSQVFMSFERMITQLLEGVVPKKMSGMKLEKVSDSMYRIPTIDSAQFEQSDFYLAVYMESADSKWIETFSEQVKVASTETIELIVSSALNGVNLAHCQRPPNKLAVKSGYEYFRLEPYGDVWQKIIEEQSLSIFMSYALHKANIEIVTVEKS